MMQLKNCPVLQRPIWDEEDVMVAADWAMEHGADEAWKWSDLLLPPERNRDISYLIYITPQQVRHALEANIDPLAVIHLDPFTSGYINASLWDSRSSVTFDELGFLGYTERDFVWPTRVAMAADCAQFQKENKTDIREYMQRRYGGGWREAGDMFWHARNLHGGGHRIRGHYLGFTGEVGIRPGKPGSIANRLRRNAAAYGPFVLYTDANHKIHHRT